jgi:hypothetical protein
MEAKKAQAPKRRTGKVARSIVVEFHVVPNGTRWDVERDDAFPGQFANEVNTAIGLATAAALRDQQNGADASVCVQQPDGHCQHVWP